MNTLEGKRIKLTSAADATKTATGRVLALAYDPSDSGTGTIAGVASRFDVLLHLDDGTTQQETLLNGDKLEFVDDPVDLPDEIHPWVDTPPTSDGAHVRLVISHDRDGQRELLQTIELLDPTQVDRTSLAARLDTLLPRLGARIVNDLRGRTPNDTELEDAYNNLQALLVDEPVGGFVSAALGRLFTIINAIIPGKTRPPGKEKNGKKKSRVES